MMDLFSYSPEAPVLVIGAAGIDMIGRLRSEIQLGTSNPAQIRTTFGGVARNVAENLALLGQPVTILSMVGGDENGGRLLEKLAESGVDISHVGCCEQHPTGSYLAIVDKAGEMQVALDDMRAISEITPQYIQQHEALFREASLLFIDMNLPKDTLRTVMSLARKAKLPVCADPTSNSLAEKLKPYLHRLHIITPNSAEAALLTGQPLTASRRREAIHAAKKLVSLGVDIVIIALAEFGVVYATSETNGQIPAIRTNILDPTGAGDALTATFIFALLNGIPIDDAIRLGVSAASLTLGYPGAVYPGLSLEKLYDHLVI
jgi:pseudouridine kinase